MKSSTFIKKGGKMSLTKNELTFLKSELRKCNDLGPYYNFVEELIFNDDYLLLKILIVAYLRLHSKNNLTFIEKVEKLRLKESILKSLSP